MTARRQVGIVALVIDAEIRDNRAMPLLAGSEAPNFELYQEILPEFQRFDAVLVAISVDAVWSHLAFARDRNLRFPLLADFEPKGEVARRYGVYRQQDGTSERALFVLDGAGIVRWSYVSPVGINPGADGILHALEELS
jgi:peroxiredoxin (alkyl hydroperoxide reductase subunit C)